MLIQFLSFNFNAFHWVPWVTLRFFEHLLSTGLLANKFSRPKLKHWRAMRHNAAQCITKLSTVLQTFHLSTLCRTILAKPQRHVWGQFKRQQEDQIMLTGRNGSVHHALKWIARPNSIRESLLRYSVCTCCKQVVSCKLFASAFCAYVALANQSPKARSTGHSFGTSVVRPEAGFGNGCFM